MRPSNIWAALGGITGDEMRLGHALSAAVEDARQASGAGRDAARRRVASLTQELVARMERGGREHLASAIAP